MNEYNNFLKDKILRAEDMGFKATDANLNEKSILMDFQKYIVKRALTKGRYAIFADCGLGKTGMQLEWANSVSKKTNKPVLILAPLAVRGQTSQIEGPKFSVDCKIADSQSDVDGPGVYITNYDKIDHFVGSEFSGVVLDESSILKSFNGKTKRKLIDSFKNTAYRLACTATPSPNDIVELGNHAEFLGIMTQMQMQMRFFVNDLGNTTNQWRLKKHGQNDFWDFVSSWATCISRPSDIGFSDDGYNLPGLNMQYHIMDTDHSRAHDDGFLFAGFKNNATNLKKELRETIGERVQVVSDLVNSNDENWIIWTQLNDESDAVKKSISQSVDVRGSDKPENKEQRLLGFAKNEFRILSTKPKIAQFGMNYQNCSNMVFMSVDYSFESLYQAVRRCYRFGQKKEVNVHIVASESTTNVLQIVKNKMKEHENMQKKMNAAFKRGNEMDSKLVENRKYESRKDENWEMRLGDCVELIQDVPDNSIDLSIYSPPFLNLYVYSDSVKDMGNCETDQEFMDHYGFLIREKFRATRPGRLSVVHCKDMEYLKGRDGFMGMKDWPGQIIKAHEDAGWIYHARVTIWKDPVVEMQRTKALGLLWKQVRKDSGKSRVGMPDYLLIFRKNHDINPDLVKPIEHSKEDLPVDLWQQYASPVWMDIVQGNTLNGKMAKSNDDERHICPLQLDVIERALHLWSNPGDLVLSPFAGIGSEGYMSVQKKRKFLGFELKPDYYKHAINNLTEAEKIGGQFSLFEGAC